MEYGIKDMKMTSRDPTSQQGKKPKDLRHLNGHSLSMLGIYSTFSALFTTSCPRPSK